MQKHIVAILLGLAFFWPQPLHAALEPAEFPIIMYHAVATNPRLLGTWGITPKEMEADLIYLRENGYNTVVMADIIAFVNDGVPLPPKPIVLTFDDGNFGDWEYVFPLLEKYDMRAVVSILGEATDRCTAYYAAGERKLPNLTWEQVAAMHASGRVEIQNHSYNLHGARGAGRQKGEPMAAYQQRLAADLTKLQAAVQQHLGFTPTTFTYPLGVISEGSQEALVQAGFVASLSCQSGMNRIWAGDTAALFRLRRDNRPQGVPVSALLKRMA